MDEKKKAKGAAAIDAVLAGGKSSIAKATVQPVENPAAIMDEGIDISDVVYKPLEWFHLNPENEVFRGLKDDTYFAALEKDITEAGAILNPLLAMQDGTLIEGESRLIIAKKLVSNNDSRFSKVPVRIIMSALSSDEQAKRLYLGNLSRFEIDENTRLALYAKIWPDYFLGDKTGRPKAEAETAATRASIAEQTGKSERQVRRDKAIVKEAKEIAEEEGRKAPTPDDIGKARQKANEDRRERKESKKNPESVKEESTASSPEPFTIDTGIDWEETQSTIPATPVLDRWKALRSMIEDEIGFTPLKNQDFTINLWCKGVKDALDAVQKYLYE